ncbi:hypothetical protein [Bradyrhizobium sp. STM 3809]|uniref:hypothetical protein n=1 Tax=Bradyrhizobium sp. STM 3809 TaxID=551936 RepID=UPI001F0A15D3|nr:hypothetical protein [Bradyrhizobium sp. STM 3809]
MLTEVRARIDQRIAAIEAQAAAEAEAEIEAVEAAVPSADAASNAAAPAAAKRRPVAKAAITLAASAGLVGAVVTLARDHQEAITTVTDRIEGAIQSIRRDAPQMASPSAGRDLATSGSSAAESAEMTPALPSPSASPVPEPSAGRSSDPSSAMAEAMSERDMPPAPERDLTPLVEKIARDVATLQTGLQDLKASQEQASRDQAKAIEQLQASQDQLARAVRASKTEPTTVGAAARLAPRPPQPPARPPRFPNF